MMLEQTHNKSNFIYENKTALMILKLKDTIAMQTGEPYINWPGWLRTRCFEARQTGIQLKAWRVFSAHRVQA